MLSLYGAIRGLVIWWHKGDLYTEDPLQVLPEAGLVGKPVVTDYFLGTTIALQPPPYETITAI